MKQDTQQLELRRSRVVIALQDRADRRSGTGGGRLKITARALARWLRIPGKTETQRRRVRELVADLRAAGVPIVADGGGYWLAEDHRDHEDYREFLRRMGLSHLATAAQDRRRRESVGQMTMFEVEPGSASALITG